MRAPNVVLYENMCTPSSFMRTCGLECVELFFVNLFPSAKNGPGLKEFNFVHDSRQQGIPCLDF